LSGPWHCASESSWLTSLPSPSSSVSPSPQLRHQHQHIAIWHSSVAWELIPFVAQWVGRRTCDSVVVSSIPGQPPHCRSVGTGMGYRLHAGIPFPYVISNPGQLSLLPSVERKMSIGQSAVMRCGWGVKAGWLIPFVDKRVGVR